MNPSVSNSRKRSSILLEISWFFLPRLHVGFMLCYIVQKTTFYSLLSAVTCGEPTDIPNTDKAFDKGASDGRYGYKTKLTYSCKKDVAMTSDDNNNKKTEFVWSCGDDGSWSGEQPTCAGLCYRGDKMRARLLW